MISSAREIAALLPSAYSPAPVPCAGCGEPTSYEVGEDASFGETLATPLGDCYVRTHRRRECVEAARAAKSGRPVTRAVKEVPR